MEENEIFDSNRIFGEGGAWVYRGIYLIYALAIVFGEIMFLGMMANMFPGQSFVGLFAQAGAIAAGLTAIIMPLAKDHWIAPGAMEKIAWLFWGLEVLVITLNTLLAFDVANNALESSWVGWWIHVSPGSPLLSVVTWGVLMSMHPSHKARQKRMQFGIAMMNQLHANMMDAVKSQAARERSEHLAVQLTDQAFQDQYGVKVDKTRVNGHAREYAADVDSIGIDGENGHKDRNFINR